MKEIEVLKSFSTDLKSFRFKYEFNDLKVNKEYNEEYFNQIKLDLDLSEDEINKLKFLLCLVYFIEKNEILIETIKDKVDESLSQPFSTTQKYENLKTIIEECISISSDFISLQNQFGLSTVLNLDYLVLLIHRELPSLELTRSFSGLDLVQDIYKYSLKILDLKISGIDSLLKSISKDNILAFACETVSVELIALVDYFKKAHPNLINEKDINRIVKRIKERKSPPIPLKRGRPSNPIENRTIQDIWISEEYTFQDVLKVLKKERPFLDENLSFVIEINNELVWQKTPKNDFSKCIQGFLKFCKDKQLIELKSISSIKLQTIF